MPGQVLRKRNFRKLAISEAAADRDPIRQMIPRHFLIDVKSWKFVCPTNAHEFRLRNGRCDKITDQK